MKHILLYSFFIYRIITCNSTFMPQLEVNLGIVGGRQPRTERAKLTSFLSFFKVHPFLCSYLYNLIENLMPEGYLPKHLLWTFYFLYHYSTERIMAKQLHTNRETVRKWVWPTLVTIGNHLEQFVSNHFYYVCCSSH